MKEGITIKSYITGFILSLLLTLAAYFVVTNQIFSGNLLVGVVLGFAIMQLAVQMTFFLHLLDETKPRWNLIIFLTTLSIILLVIVGSLWIMNNLNYHMTATQMENYVRTQSQSGGY